MKTIKIIFLVFLIICLFLVPNSLIAQDIDKAFKYFDNEQYEKAAIEFENVLPAIIKEYGQNDTTIYTELLIYTALCYERALNSNKAENYYLKCKYIYENLGDTLNSLYALSLNNLASLYISLNNFEKAEPLYIQAMNIYKGSFDEKHPDYATSLNNLADLYNNMANY